MSASNDVGMMRHQFENTFTLHSPNNILKRNFHFMRLPLHHARVFLVELISCAS